MLDLLSPPPSSFLFLAIIAAAVPLVFHPNGRRSKEGSVGKGKRTSFHLRLSLSPSGDNNADATNALSRTLCVLLTTQGQGKQEKRERKGGLQGRRKNKGSIVVEERRKKERPEGGDWEDALLPPHPLFDGNFHN